jgi:hypothetical protein
MIEPTDEMCVAGKLAIDTHFVDLNVGGVYKAMRALEPAPDYSALTERLRYIRETLLSAADALTEPAATQEGQCLDSSSKEGQPEPAPAAGLTDEQIADYVVSRFGATHHGNIRAMCVEAIRAAKAKGSSVIDADAVYTESCRLASYDRHIAGLRAVARAAELDALERAENVCLVNSLMCAQAIRALKREAGK